MYEEMSKVDMPQIYSQGQCLLQKFSPEVLHQVWQLLHVCVVTVSQNWAGMAHSFPPQETTTRRLAPKPTEVSSSIYLDISICSGEDSTTFAPSCIEYELISVRDKTSIKMVTYMLKQRANILGVQPNIYTIFQSNKMISTSFYP